MATQTQQIVERVNLVYQSSAGSSDQEVELPFRVLVLGNFSCDEHADYFEDQSPVNVNDENINSVLASFNISLNLEIANKLTDSDDGVLSFNINLNSLEDFHPDQLLNNIPVFQQLQMLREVISNEDSSDQLSILKESLAPQQTDEESVLLRFLKVMGIDPSETPLDNISREDIGRIVSEIDIRLGEQMDELLHHADFRKLESTWRSLNFLIQRTDFRENCLIEILNVSKNALAENFEDVPEVLQSSLYQLVYSAEFGQFGGHPYSVLIGNYVFKPNARDIKILQQVSSVAAMSHAPFIASAGPEFFDIDSFSELTKIRDFKSNFDQPKFAKWISFRESEDARYLALTLPGFLLRTPYGDEDNPVSYFEYQEKLTRKDTGLWGNSAFAFATRLVDSFAKTRWCMSVSGAVDGQINGLHMQQSNTRGVSKSKIPAQVLISDRRESELIGQGFLPLSIHKGDDTAAFYSANSVQAPKQFADSEDGKAATLNHQLGAQLPYLFVVSRLSHYIKMMQREHIGSWKNRNDIEHELNTWLKQYVSDMDNPAPGVRGRRPLRKAKIEVNEVEGKGDWYLIQLTVVPHLKYMGSAFTLTETGKLDKN